METKDSITEKLIEIVGFNLFERTRQREYVEARALLIHILHNELNIGKLPLSRYLTEKGYRINHTSIIYSLKSFDAYMRFSPQMRNWYRELDLEGDIAKHKLTNEIKEKLSYLTRGDLETLNSQVKELYHDAILKEAEVIYDEVKAEL